MADEELNNEAEGLAMFAMNFDRAIAIAYESGWLKGEVEARSHKDYLIQYLKFRGFEDA